MSYENQWTIADRTKREAGLLQSFKLYTEDINRDAVLALIDKSFDGYSILSEQGAWHGKKERLLCLEIISSDIDTMAKLEAIAEAIKTENHQDAVLITRHPIDAKLV